MRKASKGALGYLVMIAMFIFMVVLLSNGLNPVDKRIEYPQLLEMIEEKKVDIVSIRGNSLEGL